MTTLFRNRIARLTKDDIVRHPVFLQFDEDWMFTTNAVSPAAVAPIQSRILADGIPAMSCAVGANALGSDAVSENIDYATFITEDWPRRDRRWLHSDIKNVAFRFNWRLYKRLVEGEYQ